MQHGVKPYQDYMINKKIKGMILVNQQSSLYIPESDVEKHYPDKLSKFVFNCNEKSSNAIFDRLSRIYDYICIDEVQDLAGYDLELIKLLFHSRSNIILVWDPRQATYSTHNEKKFTKSAFLMAKKYKGKRDLLGVLLKDDVRYSNEEVETLVNNYLKKEN